MKKLRIIIGLVLTLLLIAGPVFAADQTIAATEEMVGSGHATKTDTLNRLTLVEHETSGAHKAVMTGLAITAGKTITATQNTSLDEAVAMSSKAPLADPVFTGNVTLSGNAVNATLPSFLVEVSAGVVNVTGDATSYTVVFGTERLDQGNNFSSTTFTAPVTGNYQLGVAIQLNQIASNHTTIDIALTTSNRTHKPFYLAIGTNPFTSTLTGNSFLCDMDAGDTAVVVVYVAGGSKVVDIGDVYSRFSGHLVN